MTICQTSPTSVVPAGPLQRSVSIGQAYQASEPGLPAVVTVVLQATAVLAGVQAISGDVRMGIDAAVASGGGTMVGMYVNNLLGTTVPGLGLSTSVATTVSMLLPVGWYFAIRQVTGTGMQIVSCIEQAIRR